MEEKEPTKKSLLPTAGVSSDDYNGHSTEKYSWSQTIKDIDVKIPVSPHIRKGKDLVVTIRSDSVIVRPSDLNNPNADLNSIIVTGEFPFPIDKEESYWNLIPGETVTLFLQKEKERWWTCLLKNEEEIDPSSIKAEIGMDDLQEDEQVKIEELMWKDEQKKQGLRTNDQQNLEDVLKKAWNAEGSPFKGTPYDPNLVKLGSDNLPSEVIAAAKATPDSNI